MQKHNARRWASQLSSGRFFVLPRTYAEWRGMRVNVPPRTTTITHPRLSA